MGTLNCLANYQLTESTTDMAEDKVGGYGTRFWFKKPRSRQIVSVRSCVVSFGTMFGSLVVVGALHGFTPVNVILSVISGVSLVYSTIALIGAWAKSRFLGRLGYSTSVAWNLFAVIFNISGVGAAMNESRISSQLHDNNRLQSIVTHILNECMIYATVHDNTYPPTLEALVKLGQLTNEDLRDDSLPGGALFIPATRLAITGPVATDHEFVYVVAGAKAQDNSHRLVLYDPVMHGGLVLVASENNQTEWLRPDEVNARLLSLK
jgi:hypothetical protein